MRKPVAALALLASTMLLPSNSMASQVWNNAYTNARPMFAVEKHSRTSQRTPGTPQLPQWNGSFIDRTGKRVNFTMVGTDPSINNGGTTTNVVVVLVPVVAVYGADNGDKVFDPLRHKVSNGQTVVQNTLGSPLFSSSIDFVQGGTDLGMTQYIDAFQRGNFWNASVASNPNYHVLFNVTLGTALKIKVSPAQGQVIQNPFSRGMVGTMDVNVFDQQLEAYVNGFTDLINPGVLPVFLTDNVFLTVSGNCCIGGYRSTNGGPPGAQTYIYATYIDQRKSFARDVSALSHELGSWTDDPFLSNLVHCTNTSDLDAGGPLTGKRHEFPYTTNGFTYNLQSLVFVPYFGAPKSTSVNHWFSFQGDAHHVCPGQ